MTLIVHKKFTFNGEPYAKGEEFSDETADPRRIRQLIEGRFVLDIEGATPKPKAKAKPKRGRGRPKGARTRRRKVARKPAPAEEPALVLPGGEDEDPMTEAPDDVE